MEVFFNELSVRLASSDAEACQWLETLARLTQSLRDVTESLGDDSFTFRRSDDFGQLFILPDQTILDFLLSQYDFGDAVYVFLLGIFDSPYITADDPQRTEYDYISLNHNDNEYNATGLSATYLKQALAVSFNSDPAWDTCQIDVQINRIIGSDIKSLPVSIDNASHRQHIVDCHLPRLSALFDWRKYRPQFDGKARTQRLLPLITVFSLCLHADWSDYYQELAHCSEGERIVKIELMAKRIAILHMWKAATGTLKGSNQNRTIYTIPNSHFIVSVDTQHGEFEVHINRAGNNHLGAVSFDGLRVKPAIADRSLKL